MFGPLASCSKGALATLAVLTLLYFLESFDRYLISVAPIPYIDYGSYEYSLLAGPVFTVVYTVGGLTIALYHSDHDGPLAPGVRPSRWKLSKLGVLGLCAGVFSMAFAATAFGTEFWHQVIIRMVMGLTQSVITPFSTSIIKDLFPPETCGAAFGIFNAGTYVAFSFSLSVGTYIYQEYGWRAGYLLFGMVSMGIACLVPLLRLTSAPGVSATRRSYLALLSEEIDPPKDPEGSAHRAVGPGVEHGHLRVDIGDETGSVQHSDDNSSNASTVSAIHNSVQYAPVLSPVAADAHSHAAHSHSLHPHNRRTARFVSTETTYQRMKGALYRILFHYWWSKPGVWLLCLATGVRLGAGYLWAGYTGVFFSELFVKDDGGGSCSYSFNATLAATPGSMCGQDFPYCVDSDCSALSDYPWHNQGMASIKIEEFMSWVPIVGSAMGNVVAGFLSDYVAKRVDGDSVSMRSLALRALIPGISNLLAVPLIGMSLFMDFPGCFLIYIGSGLVGEVYLSQSLALVSDSRVVPRDLVAPAVALFMLLVTIIGGNTPLLIPALLPVVGHQADVMIDFTAASTDPSAPAMDQLFSVTHQDASQLQYTLLYALGGCYVLSSVLYLAAYALMVR